MDRSACASASGVQRGGYVLGEGSTHTDVMPEGWDRGLEELFRGGDRPMATREA